jgi:hypothetical protein
MATPESYFNEQQVQPPMDPQPEMMAEVIPIDRGKAIEIGDIILSGYRKSQQVGAMTAEQAVASYNMWAQVPISIKQFFDYK